MYKRQVVWFLCQVGDKNSPPRQIDQIRIWNHNQNEHTRRGLNKVYVEYSADGQTWQLLPDGRLDYLSLIHIFCNTFTTAGISP